MKSPSAILASAPGATFTIRINQGDRPATVLARDGDIMLVEYVLPGGTTALAFAKWRPTSATPSRAKRIHRRPCTYNALTKAWLVKIVEQGRVWVGRSSSGQVPRPAELLHKRFPALPLKHARRPQDTSMPINFNVSPEDQRLIQEIAKQAVAVAADNGMAYPHHEAVMDLTACHANGCPLDLKRLLRPEVLNSDTFAHDVLGIRRHINRTTGKMPATKFRPRCMLKAAS